MTSHVPGVGEVYPGWVAGWVLEGTIPGTTQHPPPGPIFSIFKARGPTHGPLKAILEVSMRFPRID